MNAQTLMGNTPLYLAVSAGCTQAAELLREHGGQMHVASTRLGPGADILDQFVAVPKQGGSVIHMQSHCIGMPSEHLMY